MNCKTIKTTSAAIVGANLVLTIPKLAFNNCQQFKLIICQNIPAITGTLPVVIQDGALTYPLLLTNGNNTRSDMLRSRACYLIQVGTNPNHFTVLPACKLCRTSFIYSALIPAGAGTATEAETSKEETHD